MTGACSTKYGRRAAALKWARHFKFLGKRLRLLIVLCGLAALPVRAQETEWQEAHDQIQKLNDAGRYSESLPLAINNLQYAKDHFGLNQPDTATSLGDLAEVNLFMGQYSDAELLLRQALDMTDKAIGTNNGRAAGLMNDLGYMYLSQGEYHEAEPLLRRAMDILKTSPASAKQEGLLLATMNNVAVVEEQEGKFPEAEQHFQDLTDRKEKAFGPDDPGTLAAAHNLARVYGEEAKFTEAIATEERVIASWERSLGPNHPNVAAALDELGRTYGVRANLTKLRQSISERWRQTRQCWAQIILMWRWC